MPLCSHNRLARNTTRCAPLYPEVSMRYLHMFYSWPGGAVCGTERQVARCPRSWT